MKIKASMAPLKQTKWYEYAIRFVLGGAITIITGLIAKKYGPNVGGLFLAFPAIFPASATLIEKHERQNKERSGLNGALRARIATALDAGGASIGIIGLMAFAVLAWKFLPAHETWVVLIGSTVAWFAVAVILWRICEE
jgi:uncharacterized membrane protein (GlpM family)